MKVGFKKKNLENPHITSIKMTRKKREDWFWRKLGFSNSKNIPSHIKKYGARLEGITDEDIEIFTKKVKELEIAVLGENEITNSGVKYLSSLKSINYLDLKGNSIDDDCIEDLINFQSLNELNVRFTGISIFGFRMIITSIPSLKTISFTVDRKYEEEVNIMIEEFPDVSIRVELT